jgi:predicted O-methyltransferase YrrM
MATRLNVSVHYGTHLAALIRAFDRTDGPCLELGMGVFSTPYLHYACQNAGRHLTSYENDVSYAEFFAKNFYPCATHQIRVVSNWDDAALDRPWDVALVDHSPSQRRIVDILRLANCARYIVIHDSEPKYDMLYHYSRIYDQFRYRAVYDREWRHAAVLSNFHDLEGFWN